MGTTIPLFRDRGKSDLIDRAYGVKNYLLAVGPTYPHKNFETLIDAYASLDPRIRKDHPLVIAGGMKAYIAKLKLLVRRPGSATTSISWVMFL